MQWELTMLVVHLVAVMLLALLYGKAPCWIQRLVVLGLLIAMVIVASAYAGAIAGVAWWRELRELGLAFEHLAVLLYVFRIVLQGGLHGSVQRTPAAR